MDSKGLQYSRWQKPVGKLKRRWTAAVLDDSEKIVGYKILKTNSSA